MKCIVKGCSSMKEGFVSKKINQLQFYDFPEDPKARKIWEDRIRQATSQTVIDTSGQICEMHFEDGNRKKLPSKFFVDDEWVELQDNNKVRIVLEFEDGETDQFCRVCLERSDSYLVSLDSNEISSTPPKELMKFVAGIEVNGEEDLLPQTVCEFCVHSLEEAAKVKKKCIESDKHLKELIGAAIKMEEESMISEKFDAMDTMDSFMPSESEMEDTKPVFLDEPEPAPKKRKVYQRPKPKKEIPIEELDAVNFRCKNCNKKLANLQMLQYHASRCLQKYYLCEICPEVIECKSNYNSHMKLHEQNGDPPLEICENEECGKMKFYTRESIDAHPCLLNDPSLEKFCFLCDEDSVGPKHFDEHRLVLNHVIKEHRRDGKFVCPYSECFGMEPFKTPNSLWHHARSHFLPSASYICSACGEIFGDKFNRDLHFNMHRARIVYECDICGDKFHLNKNKLLKHMQSQHLLEKELFYCDLCLLPFHMKQKVDEHKLKVHGVVGEGATACEICGAFILSKNSIPSHMKTHQRQSYDCEVCGAQFTNNQHLKYHVELVHVRKTDHQCPICQKYFLKSWHVTKHIRFTHDPFKKFECSFCGHRSRKRAEYEAHVRVHTGERPYRCYIEGCDKTYKDIKTARLHLRRVHKETPDSQKLKDCSIGSSINSDLPLV